MIRNWIYSALAFGALATAATGLAGGAAAAGSAADSVVNGLQSDGFVVHLNQTPTAPLSACTVTNVEKASGATTGAAWAYVDVACPQGC